MKLLKPSVQYPNQSILLNELGCTGRIWWITAVHNRTLEEKNNQSLLTVEESMNGLLSGTMKKSLTEGMIQNLKELKLAAEKK